MRRPMMWRSIRSLHSAATKTYDAVVLGGGHNGLVAAAYLQKHGRQVCVLERRAVVGGAAITEEIIPGFKFSRASYVVSLLRAQIYKELELQKHGLKIHRRNPSSYTPLGRRHWKGSARSLVLGSDADLNKQQIAQFSVRDAEVFHEYEALIKRMATVLDPLFDVSPARVDLWMRSTWPQKLRLLLCSKELRKAVRTSLDVGQDAIKMFELLTAPPHKVLSHWFESEPLIATLATDAVIGSMTSPMSSGSGYVLLHHMMGDLLGERGAWGYPEGGMGAVTSALASAAKSLGADIITNKHVKRIHVNDEGRAVGLVTAEGELYSGKLVLSNATARTTFLDLVPPGILDTKFEEAVKAIDYTSPVTKINVAVSKLPNFVADPNRERSQDPMAHHQATIHLNSDSTEMIHKAYLDAVAGRISSRPMVEMVIPSVLDSTIAPPGCHVCLLFTQYTPYTLADGQRWDDQTKEDYANLVFSNIERYAPGFTESVVGKEVLSPVDLEKIFGLTGGNIFHGAISPHQMFFHRPVSEQVKPRALSPYTPVSGLLLCGSGAHPGGGVTGAPGRIAALEALRILKTGCYQVQ